jgi:hypothetical protein
MAPNFTPDELDNDFFTVLGVIYRGALGSTDWTDWCAQETDYCPELQQRRSKDNINGRLHIAPNPANGTAYALFDADKTGKVQVNVLDKVSGQSKRTGIAQQ